MDTVPTILLCQGIAAGRKKRETELLKIVVLNVDTICLRVVISFVTYCTGAVQAPEASLYTNPVVAQYKEDRVIDSDFAAASPACSSYAQKIT